MLPYLLRAVRQSLQRPRLRPRGARRGRGRARAGGALPPRGQGGDRVHLRRHRIRQHGGQGHRRRAGPRAHHDLRRSSTTPSSAACQALEKAGFEADVPAGGRPRHGRSRRRAARAPARHHRWSRIMHANSEVGTIQPVRRDRAHHPRAGDSPPRGRGADLRQASARPRRLRHRPPVLLAPQDLRAEGRGRALHPQGHQDGRRSSTAGSTSGAAAPAPRTSPASSASARRWRCGPATWPPRRRGLAALRDRLWAGLERAGAGGAAQRPPDRAAARHLQRVLPARRVRIHRARAGSEGHRRCRQGRPVRRATSSPRTCSWRWAMPLDWAMGAVRCSLGRTTTAEDIDYVVDCVEPLVAKLRSLSPLKA